MRIRLLAAAAAAALLAAPASAQRTYGYEEIASDLAYGFCPLFLAGMFPLDSPQLAERGFGKEVATQPNPRFGEVSMVTVKRAEGTISFGGAAGKVCTVVATGNKRAAALARLRETMAWTGLDFKPAEHNGPKLPGVTIDTFKAPADAQFLNVQLIDIAGEEPSIVAQLFATEE